MIEPLATLGLLIEIYGLIKSITTSAKNIKLKQELVQELEVPIKDATDALDCLIESIYLCTGAYILSITIKTQNPTEYADNIADQLIENFENFETKMKRLVGYLEAHRELVIELSGNKRLFFEKIMWAYQQKNVDWDMILEDKDVKKYLNQKSKVGDEGKLFRKELNSKLMAYMCPKNISTFNDLDQIMEAFSDPEIVVQMVDIITKLSKKRSRTYRTQK